MADLITDGMTRVAFVLAIANIAAPTTTELNAGTLLHDVMTADGLVGFQPDTADVPTSKFSSTFDTVTAGRISYSGTMLRFCKQDTDPIFAAMTYKTAGFIVVRRSLLATTAWTAAQKSEVYPVVCGERKRLDPEPNTLERWEAPLKISSQPNLDATVA
jgi:hypothetical protein